jgi:transposase-like protein
MSKETGVTEQPQRRTRSESAQIVAQFANSGLNRTEFCRRHGRCRGTLNRHLERLRGSNTTSSDGLVAVELAGGNFAHHSRDRHDLAGVLAGGRRIEVSAGFDAPRLQRLVVLLEAR